MKLSVKIIISVLACIVIGTSASIFTNTSLGSWFTTLNKPSWNPPNWLFGPVWTTLFILMGIAFALVWEEWKPKGNALAKVAMIWFVVQFIFNVLWSFSFFGLQSPLIGLINILILLVLIVITIWRFYGIKPVAAWLLVPYLLWTSFATILNGTILMLN